MASFKLKSHNTTEISHYNVELKQKLTQTCGVDRYLIKSQTQEHRQL